MMKRIITGMVWVLLFMAAHESHATHLMGGNLGYEYIGLQPNGMYRYRIVFKTYTNCGPDSDVPNPEPNLNVGIYYHNAASPDADKQLYKTVTVTLADTTRITPDLPNGCTVGQNTCIIEGVYEAIVDMDQSFDGYWLYYNRCCRNSDIINLNNPGAQGMSFVAFIPSTLVNNSSPVFSDLPLPFICVGDTTSILNTAFDTDGDLLIFSFVNPYNGNATQANPAPAPPANLTWPVPTVTYAPNYSKDQPFGPGGYSYINGSTGYTIYHSPLAGKFIVVVEIREYRNGKLIGITRRDMQLLVINCPNNPSPKLSSIIGGGKTNYTITEGDSLCFDMAFYDELADSLTFVANGPIFDSAQFNPPATVVNNVIGDSMVLSTFCWHTACGQSSALPYLFTVKVTDNGCPPKSHNEVYSIKVDPFDPGSSITGPVNACKGDTSLTYGIPGIPGATYTWNVTGGTITSGQGTNSIGVNWGGPGAGNVQVVVTSPFGCTADPIDLPVSINPLPVASAGMDTIICKGDSVVIGDAPTGPFGSIYDWSPGAWIVDSTAANPVVFPADSTTFVVKVTNANGCINYDTMTVDVRDVAVNAGPDIRVCSGDTVTIGGSPTGPAGSTYAWYPSATLNDSTLSNPSAWPPGQTTYTVIITDSLGCRAKDSIQVDFSNPLVDAGPDQAICLGDSITLSGSGGVTYAWYPSLTLNDTTLAGPKGGPSDTTTYYLIVTDTLGCTAQDSVLVTVNPLPLPYAGPGGEICMGDTLQLTGSGGQVYSWSPPDSLSDPNIFNPLSFPSDTMTYHLTVTDSNGCSAVDSVTVIVNPLPTADAGNDTAFCAGDSVQLVATGGQQFYWSPGGTLSDSTIFDPIAFPSATTLYMVLVTDSNGCTQRDSVAVIVNPLPTADAGLPGWVCPGDSVLLNASGGGTYLWSPPAGLSDTTVFNPWAGPAGTTTYHLTVADSNGCMAADSVTVTVNAEVPVEAGPDAVICAGDSVVIGSFPTAPAGSAFLWSPSAGLSNINAANPSASPTTTTTYYVTAINDTCSGLDSVTVVVHPLPAADAGPGAQLCAGDSVQLVATGGLTYGWTPGATLSDSTVFNPFASPSDTTVYYVLITDSNGCKNTDSVTVVFNPLPVADAGPDVQICLGDSTQLVATGGQQFYWTPGGSLSDSTIFDPYAKPSDTTLYHVLVTDSNGCFSMDSVAIVVRPLPVVDAGSDVRICAGDSIQLVATGGQQFYWTPGATLSDSMIFNPYAGPSDTTLYHVVVTDSNGCANSDSVTVIVNPLPVADAGADTTVCTGGSVQLSGSGGLTYTWWPGSTLSDSTLSDPVATPPGTATYFMTATDSNGCRNTDSVTVAVNPLPVVDAGPDVYKCIGDTVQLSASGGVSYTWMPPLYLNDPNVPGPFTHADTTLVYTVNVTDSNNCTGSDSVTVNVFTITTSSDTTICAGDTVTISATGSGTAYTWTPGGSLSDSTVYSPQAFPTTTTVYQVTVTNPAGCMAGGDVTVNVSPSPLADFLVTREYACEGISFVLSNTSVNADTYLWHFGDGTTSSLTDPVYETGYPGGLTEIRLIARNAWCVDSVSSTEGYLNIEDAVTVREVNVFTPNNDGINDCFHIPLGDNISNCGQLIVFNRWGVRIYDNIYGICWDGKTDTGYRVPEGTYYYIYTIGSLQVRGHVMLID